MRKLILIPFAVVFCGIVAHAQQQPVADVAIGYSVIEVPASNITANGGSGSLAVNLNGWFGVASDFGVYHSGVIGSGLAAGTYTFGPRFSYRRTTRFIPFVQALAGGVRTASNGFAFGAGGGADFGLDKAGRFAVRPQVEYFGFRLNNTTTNTVRVCIGFVVRIGRR